MSARWSIRSDGSPYLVFGQLDFSGMDLVGGFQSAEGMTRMEVEFALHSMPIRFASNEEAHPVWVFRDAITLLPLLGVYVTPSGRVVALGPDGTGPVTPISYLRPDGVFHVATAKHNGLTGVTSLVIDGITITAAATAVYAAPQLGQLMLMNGPSGLTRCQMSVRYARAYGPTDIGGIPVAQWNISEGEGRFLTSITQFDGNWDFANLELTGHHFTPSGGGNPWGPVPPGDPGDSFDWRLKTPWTRVARTPTLWRRSRVTWPS